MHNLEKMPEEGILLPKNPASKTRIFFELTEALEKKEPLFVEGISDSLKSLLALCFRGKWILYLCKTEERAKEILQDGKIFAENCLLFPAKDYLFYKADTRGNYISRERSECLRQLVEEEEGVLVTTLPAMLEKLEGKNAFRQAVFTVQLGQTLSLESLQDSLHSLGYQRVDQVESRGEYSLRGGILDVFSNQMEEPLRIEFFDDEVDSLRYFSLESQRSLEQVEEANIYPVSEQGKPSSLKAFSLLDYLPKDCLVIVDEPVRVLEEGKRVEEEFIAYFSQRAEAEKEEANQLEDKAVSKKKGVKGRRNAEEGINSILESENREKDQRPLDLFSVRTLMEECASRPIFFFSSLGGLSEWSEVFENPLKSISVECREIPFYGKQFAQFKGDMEKYKKEKVRISLYSPSQSRASRLAEELRQEGLSAYCPDRLSEDREDGEDTENAGSIRVLPRYLRKGFYLPQEKLLVMTEQDLYGQSLAGRKRRKKKQVESLHIGSLTELHKGDYVVHESHGIGIYEGIERIVTDGVSKDYLKILYGDGGNLYLPVNKLDGIEKYAGKEAKAPKLNRLNGSEWQKTKSKVKGAVREIAKELLALYAKRQEERGYPFGKDTVWQREFEEAFPYEETGDQLLAIEATKEDMESEKIMDRLVCGDVGYGKTEIALRAAFKAVQDSKQVAYLCPTTILAQQIYNGFVERMKGFPVEVGILSRFQSQKEVHKTLEQLASGRIDILVGTHRLLSKDVQFKNLGLLVVDEEQRFGVQHKERIKSLKENVDVLTLSATPIPRTLHMSLVGIRDLSILEEAPMDRLPIQTYVMEEEEGTIREAISRELRRNGQVYYVHNRVKSIEDTALRLQKLLPEARIAYAHGQMGEKELEEIMLSFIAGEIDVLVSTTIIETGLDIPNANTLIIQDADKMGLSQLYQIRGRVGRSNRTSYAFLLYKKGKSLTEESEKRLKAIREFTELGSGIRIALRDLEIRGAGNVLGAEQHGHMEAVGYELYTKLLRHAVLLEKGEKQEEEDFETQLDVDLDAFIPENYMENEEQKLEAYQKIALLSSEEEKMDLEDELTDRYGDLPYQVENLFQVASLRNLLHKIGVTECKIKRGEIHFLFFPKAKINTAAIPTLISESQGEIRFVNGESPKLLYRKKNLRDLPKIQESMEKAKEIAEALLLPLSP